MSKLYLHLFKDGEYWNHWRNLRFDNEKKDYVIAERNVGEIMEVLGGYKVKIVSLDDTYSEYITKADVEVLYDPWKDSFTHQQRTIKPDSILDPVALAYKYKDMI